MGFIKNILVQRPGIYVASEAHLERNMWCFGFTEQVKSNLFRTFLMNMSDPVNQWHLHLTWHTSCLHSVFIFPPKKTLSNVNFIVNSSVNRYCWIYIYLTAYCLTCFYCYLLFLYKLFLLLFYIITLKVKVSTSYWYVRYAQKCFKQKNTQGTHHKHMDMQLKASIFLALELSWLLICMRTAASSAGKVLEGEAQQRGTCRLFLFKFLKSTFFSKLSSCFFLLKVFFFFFSSSGLSSSWTAKGVRGSREWPTAKDTRPRLVPEPAGARSCSLGTWGQPFNQLS